MICATKEMFLLHAFGLSKKIKYIVFGAFHSISRNDEKGKTYLSMKIDYTKINFPDNASFKMTFTKYMKAYILNYIRVNLLKCYNACHQIYK